MDYNGNINEALQVSGATQRWRSGVPRGPWGWAPGLLGDLSL